MRFLGKLLTVNPTTGRIECEELPQALTEQLLFARGINAWLMANHVDRDIDPIAPEIVLAFSCGLLTGTQAPASP